LAGSLGSASSPVEPCRIFERQKDAPGFISGSQKRKEFIMWQRIKEEPVYIQGIIQAALALGISFRLHLSPEQVGAILALTAAVLSFLTRKKVTPLCKLNLPQRDWQPGGPSRTPVRG
jgi:hypothetical protein